MTDIQNRDDIERLLTVFYDKALKDDVIGFYFTEVVPLDMKQHIPVITNFWETVLFGKASYKGNAMEVHQRIHRQSAFTDAHFARWVKLFTETVNELFSGEKATLATQRAESIATIMRLKTVYGGSVGFPPNNK